MAEIKLNHDNCSKCRACINECTMRYLARGEDGFPVFNEESFCNFCGHCEALCPNEAIWIEGEDYAPFAPDFSQPAASKVEFSDLVTKRRSIRKFTKNQVDKALIREILEVVRFAPSGSNSQQVNWMVIHDRNELNKLIDFLIDKMQMLQDQNHPMALRYNFAGFASAWKKHQFDLIFRGAPHLAIAYTPKDNKIGLVDATIALTHFDLALPRFGLGGTWAGFFFLVSKEFNNVEEFLGLPEGSAISGGIFFGEPAAKYLRVPKRIKKEILWK